MACGMSNRQREGPHAVHTNRPGSNSGAGAGHRCSSLGPAPRSCKPRYARAAASVQGGARLARMVVLGPVFLTRWPELGPKPPSPRELRRRRSSRVRVFPAAWPLQASRAVRVQRRSWYAPLLPATRAPGSCAHAVAGHRHRPIAENAKSEQHERSRGLRVRDGIRAFCCAKKTSSH